MLDHVRNLLSPELLTKTRANLNETFNSKLIYSIGSCHIFKYFNDRLFLGTEERRDYGPLKCIRMGGIRRLKENCS